MRDCVSGRNRRVHSRKGATGRGGGKGESAATERKSRTCQSLLRVRETKHESRKTQTHIEYRNTWANCLSHIHGVQGGDKEHGVLRDACFSACEGKRQRCVVAAAEVSSKPGRGSQITRRCFLLLQSLPVEWGSALSTFGAAASRTGCHTDPRRGKKGRRPFQGALFFLGAVSPLPMRG